MHLSKDIGERLWYVSSICKVDKYGSITDQEKDMSFLKSVFREFDLGIA